MEEIRFSCIPDKFPSKPSDKLAALLSNEIARRPQKVTRDKIKHLAKLIGEEGYPVCTATFKIGSKSKSKENFEQTQFLALDFDNKSLDKSVSFEEVKNRADYYDLPILFAYDTMSSVEHNKFRVFFLNDVSIPNIKVAETMLHALHTICPEADPQGKSAVQMYYGGDKELLYSDDTVPEINIESLFRNLTNYLEDKHGVTNIRRHTEKFSQDTGLALNQKGKFDVSMVEDISDDPETESTTEDAGASSNDDKNSPSPFIIIKGIGGKLSRKYILNFDQESTRTPSVGQRKPGGHLDYRSADLAGLGIKCQLFKEFQSGERRLPQPELFGIATCMVNVESGPTRFMEILRDTSRYDHRPEKYRKWEQDLRRMKDYKPRSCNGFCPYKDICSHGTNMLSKPKRGKMERLVGYVEEFDTLENVQIDVYNSISKAYHDSDVMWHIIKAMTAIGKTTSYLRLMKENPEDRFLIASPTNILKDQIYDDAIRIGINVMKTPSLEEMKDDIPDDVWGFIQFLYKSGQHSAVQQYINETLEKRDIPCLKEYTNEREKLKKFKGSVITTHRYLMSMNEKRLSEYDAVIVDEDIIFKSVISNQCEITVSALNRLSEETSDSRLSKKIKRLVQLSRIRQCINLNSFKLENDEDALEEKIEYEGVSTPFDTPSFCKAKKFYIRKASEEKNLEEDTVVFIKPAIFKDIKYIMVSATVDEKICRAFFGEGKINFYGCKKVKYKGNLYQYSQKSMSRTSIDNAPGIIPRLTKHFGIDDENVITHKGYGKGPLWFGNTEGCNSMEGEDILVAGTPYHAEFLYNLVAFTLGLPFDKKAEMKEQMMTHNGYRFWFNTYHDDALRDVHFWMIESELEQAVGRARLLRHDCIVHLCSNFPLSQAQPMEYNLDK